MQSVFAACKQLFKNLPLAALINKQTLVLHGGLYRTNKGTGKRKHVDEFTLGSLEDFRTASKGGLDPGGYGQSQLAADILWSDPSNETGFVENYGRGIGIVFGPDITRKFLLENHLKLIIRSHEGPDAREMRPDMPKMDEGYTIDHETSSGKLMTVFSAPDYPQFVCADSKRYENKAAVVILNSPDYSSPEIKQYEAVLPRPKATPYYDLEVPDSDEEYEKAGSDVSGMSDVASDN